MSDELRCDPEDLCEWIEALKPTVDPPPKE
jgi:hypothetical protein